MKIAIDISKSFSATPEEVIAAGQWNDRDINLTLRAGHHEITLEITPEEAASFAKGLLLLAEHQAGGAK